MKQPSLAMLGRAFALIGLAAAAPAHAQPAPVYDNGGPDLGAYATNFGVIVVASPFHLTETAHVTRFRFWTLENAAYGYTRTYAGNLFWEVLSGGPTDRLEPLRSGTEAGTRTLEHAGVSTRYGTADLYRREIDIAPLRLGPGMYWLALAGGPVTSSESTVGLIHGRSGIARYDWLSDGYGRDFFNRGPHSEDPERAAALRVYASETVVPEPVSMALLGTGLAGVAVARRRRRPGKRDEPA